MLRTLLVLTSALLFGSVLGCAETLHVPENYPTIQAAIDSADPGDTIFVGAGRYEENLIIGKPLELIGMGGTDVQIRPADPEQPVLWTRPVTGEVAIEGFTASDGERGVRVDTSKNSIVRLADVIVVGNEAGIEAGGQGCVWITHCVAVDNTIGVGTAAARTELIDTEISRGDVGVVLFGDCDITISRCLIGLTERGISTYAEACGYDPVGAVFGGTVNGQDNRILATQTDLCPGYPGSPWPDGFVNEAWREAASEIEAAYRESMFALDGQDYAHAREACLKGFSLIADGVQFPLLDAYLRHGIGLADCMLGHYEDALAAVQAARAIYDSHGMEADVAKVDNDIGWVHRIHGRYKEALAAYEAARAFFVDCGMRVDIAKIDANIGDVHADMGRYEEALAVLQSARAIYVSYGMEADVANVDNSMGVVYTAAGRYGEALAVLRSARDVYRNHRMDVSVADVDCNIGNICANIGLYEEAIAAYESAHAVFAVREMQVDTAKVSENLGTVYSELGRYEEALALYDAARGIYARHGMDLLIAGVDTNTGIVYEELGWYEGALALYDSARAVFGARGMEMAVARLSENIGLVLRGLGRYEEALAVFEAARATYIAHEMEVEAAEACVNIGALLDDLGRSEEALASYQATLDVLDAIAAAEGMEYSHPTTRWALHYNMGVAYQALEEWGEAVAAYETSLMVIESIRTTLSSEELKLAWQERTKDVYERLIDLLFRLGETDAALTYAERCRARTFLDLVAMGPVGNLENVADEGIRTSVVEPSTIEFDLAEVVAALPADTAALEYFVTEGGTYLWLIRDGSASEPIRIEISRAELLEQVLAFRMTIETTSTELSELPHPEEGMETMSRDLYGLLIAPAEDQLSGIDHLVIVPSGPLYYLPLCALLRCPGCEGADLLGGTYLIERFSLSYAPSLTTLKYAWDSVGDARTDPLFLALADPDSGDPALHRLPEAQDEARTVANLFEPSEVYVDSAATEDVVTERAGSADQILLSTHGLFNPHNPMFSYLLLSPTEDHDGKLYTHEVFSLDLQTDLVTLSACETLLPALEDAQAQVRAMREMREEEGVELDERLLETLTSGDEIVGLTRAFLAAGTPSVLSSLWRVVSETTEPLMVAFYRYLEAGLNKAEALRQAQLDVKASYPHPCYWAAFSLVGDWGKEAPDPNAWLSRLSSELHEAWSAWQSEEHGPDDEAPRVTVLMTMTESATDELLSAISELSEEITIRAAYGHFVEVDVPVDLLPALCALPEVEFATPRPPMTTNSP